MHYVLPSRKPASFVDYSTPNAKNTLRILRTAILAGLAFAVGGRGVDADDPINLTVPEGFQVDRYADDDLAHDIHSMTIDSLGRVVVSGPGYVRILLDTDEDGIADEAKQFVDGPARGSQGMYFHGRDLVCTGDDGLQIYRDDNRDDRADGEPEVFLRIATGSEHNVHSIQKGPDGWWYVIAGNLAGVSGAYASLPTSPLKQCYAGVVMRIHPSFFGSEIIADGFRNAYDFAFVPSGDLFTWDSDGERDVSLPWYRPTRVFQVLPKSNAGWVSRSWKRPDDDPDVPPVVASFGRGSPTGVACYRHSAFPAAYHGALFVLDWTFGRVDALPLRRDGDHWTSEPVQFLRASGQFGFAPTDVAIGPDGSLFVSVGGRGTRGSVFRIRYIGTQTDATADATAVDDVSEVLSAPQPESSWSRAEWVPIAEALGADLFQTAASEETRPVADRLRAIEILTELFGGPDEATVTQLAKSSSPEIRARTAWAIGRSHPESPDVSLLANLIADDDPMVARHAIEALMGATEQAKLDAVVAPLARQFGSPHRVVRQSAARAAAVLTEAQHGQLLTAIDATNPHARIAAAFATVRRPAKPQVSLAEFEVGLQVLEQNASPEGNLEAARLMQLALGDVGPASAKAPVYDSYTPQVSLEDHRTAFEPLVQRLAKVFPTGQPRVDEETARVLAMVAPVDTALPDRLAGRITRDSDPVSDIHYLLVASRNLTDRSEAQTDATAQALFHLQVKIDERGLKQDSNWDDRIGELLQQMTSVDANLAAKIIGQSGFGRPNDVLFLGIVPDDQLPMALASFAKQIQSSPDYAWTNDIVFALGRAPDAVYGDLVRGQYDNFAVRDAVVKVLARSPEEQDRPKFLEGLNSSGAENVRLCLEALLSLEANNLAAENIALVRCLRRLGDDPREYVPRDKVVRLLQRNTGQELGFVLGEDGQKPQSEASRAWVDWMESTYASELKRESGGDSSGLKSFHNRLAKVDWQEGVAERGRSLFEKRGCLQCHGSRRALGPDLAGVTKRFNRDDLFTSIVDPNRDVSPRYRTTMIETGSGTVVAGLVIYDSIDGVLLRDATNQTIRVNTGDIESRREVPLSLMPNGLLRDLKPADLADLFAYLQSLDAPDND